MLYSYLGKDIIETFDCVVKLHGNCGQEFSRMLKPVLFQIEGVNMIEFLHSIQNQEKIMLIY